MTGLKHGWIMQGLAHQLIDESRHAEMLSNRIEELGFDLGMVPTSLHTWNCYRSFDTVVERVIAQQILQEGVGLDSSCLNIERFRSVGDNSSSELYEKITMDEVNHVKLGVRIVKVLAGEAADEIVKATQKRVAETDPLPIVPKFIELRRRAELPEDWT